MKILTNRRFWKLIKKSQSVMAPSPRRQHDRMVKRLKRLNVSEIIMFHKTFLHYMNLADTQQMRGAAQVVKGIHDQDYFDNFRAWLIMRGGKSYFRVLRNPERLRKILKYSDDPEWKGFMHCASEAYLQKTGKDMSEDIKEPSRTWKDAELAERFPRLWKKFVQVEETLDYE